MNDKLDISELKEVLANFVKIGQTNALYRQLIQEMEAAKTVCEDYFSK